MSYPIVKPSDARSWNLCLRRVWLENKAEVLEEPIKDEFEKLIIDLGLQHENGVLQKLRTAHEVAEAHSVEDTIRLMAGDVEIIYQGQLVDEDEGLIGNPDFLIRNDKGEYQAADAKLSLDVNKTEIQVQIGFYRRMLGNYLPGIVFLGDGTQEIIGDESNQITNRFIDEMRDLLSKDFEPSARYGHTKCKACPFLPNCKPGFEDKGELTLLYGIDKRAAAGLEQAGISSINELASTEPASIPDIPYLKFFEKKERAVLQAKSYLTGEVYHTHSLNLPGGNWIHFDIEDYPLTRSGKKHVYLWGFLVPEYTNHDFEYVWTDNEEQDKEGWLCFLEKVEDYRKRFTPLVLAHYSRHELTTIEEYATRFEMEEDKTVKYLLGEDSPLFDLLNPVKDNFVLPLLGRSLKDVCKHKNLVNFQWSDNDSGSQWSIVEFHNYLTGTDCEKKNNLKSKILEYNRDDVLATHMLEQWLRSSYFS